MTQSREPKTPRLLPAFAAGVALASLISGGGILLVLIVQYDILRLLKNTRLLNDLVRHLPAETAAAVIQGNTYIASHTQWTMLIVVLVAVSSGVFSVLLIVFMSHAVVHPIQRMIEALRHFQHSSDPPPVLRREHWQEWNDLAAAMDTLNQSLHQLRQRHTELEQELVERRQLHTKLLELATTDSLTGLHNRRHFMETASQEFERARRYRQPLSLLIIDADRFKAINDRFGHHVGDDVLKNFAVIGRRQLRDIDLFARMGGEEFAVLLPQTDFTGARVVAERLRLAIADCLIDTEQGPISFTVSIGMACLAPGIMDLDDLLHAADAALYQAKQKGRNRVEPAP